MCETELPPWGMLWQPFWLLYCNNNLFMFLTIHCSHFDSVLCILNPKIMHRMKIGHAFSFLWGISITGDRLGRHLEYWSYARFAKVANAWFENYRPRRTVWYIITNVVLRRPLTPISRPLLQSYLLHITETSPYKSNPRFAPNI